MSLELGLRLRFLLKNFSWEATGHTDAILWIHKLLKYALFFVNDILLSLRIMWSDLKLIDNELRIVEIKKYIVILIINYIWEVRV